jgi:signal transduction histidine kinase
MENTFPAPPIIIRVKSIGNEEVIVQVIDRGPGVPDPEKIFDAFATTKEKGMGVGLAVSRSIVAAHQGELWAENNSESGATFTFTLPLDKAVTQSHELDASAK